ARRVLGRDFLSRLTPRTPHSDRPPGQVELGAVSLHVALPIFCPRATAIDPAPAGLPVGAGSHRYSPAIDPTTHLASHAGAIHVARRRQQTRAAVTRQSCVASRRLEVIPPPSGGSKSCDRPRGP